MRTASKTALLAASLLVAACGDAFSPEGVAGFYQLKTVNGQPLPYQETSGSITIAVTAGSITLNPNSTWSLSITFNLTEGGTTITQTETDSGTFTLVEPATIRFTSSDGDTFAGTIDGKRVTIIEDGDTFVLEK